MDAKHVEARAVELFEGGLHCAEAALVAVLEGQEMADVSPRAATAFGGGVGRSKAGPCGALTGALVALGLAQGRDDQRAEWGGLAAKAAELSAWFAETHGCTRCSSVLERLGPQEGMDKCIALTGRTAARTHEILSGAVAGRAASCGCTARTAAAQLKSGSCCGA